MSTFQDLLEELKRLTGVRGVAIATTDGIAAASCLQGRYRDDVVVGLASFLISTTRRAMGSEVKSVDRFVMHSTHGKLILQDIGEAFLIVITDQFVRLETLEPDVNDVVRRLRRLARLDV